MGRLEGHLALEIVVEKHVEVIHCLYSLLSPYVNMRHPDSMPPRNFNQVER